MKILVDGIKKEIKVPVVLTAVSGKVRLKNRSIVNEYGVPFAVKQTPISGKTYVEWQIGYDVATSDKEKMLHTTLEDRCFTGANGKEITLYELSEYIYYALSWGVISKNTIDNIRDFLVSLDDSYLLDGNPSFPIERTHLIPKTVAGIDFEYTQVKYPLLIHRFKNYEVIAEIKITEKQRAVGVQPMLFFCYSASELESSIPLIGRTAETKEIAYFIININNIGVFIDMLKIFGLLSKGHKKDIVSLIAVLLKS